MLKLLHVVFSFFYEGRCNEYFQESPSNSSEGTEEAFVPITTFQPHFPNQSELDALIRDLGLTKSGAELPSSRLMEWNLLREDCRT